MEFTIIRHTQVRPPENICYGWYEVPLAESFPLESEALRKKLEPEQPDLIWSSPAERCVRLAEVIAPGRWQKDERLRELSFGQWEGKAWNAIPQGELQPWIDDFVHVAPPGGESLQALYQRVEAALTSLLATDAESVLLITHAGVIRCIWSYVLEIPLANLFKMPVGYGEIFRATLSASADFNQIRQKM